jgi:hypothetical protein
MGIPETIGRILLGIVQTLFVMGIGWTVTVGKKFNSGLEDEVSNY